MLELEVHDEDRVVVLKFEHSLHSLSKWEEKNKKPFLSHDRNSYELIDYFKEMLLEDADPNLVYRLAPEQLETLGKYINEKRTASSVPRDNRPSEEQVTSELIYYWMGELGIDWEAKDWHLSRLLILVEIANFKRQPVKKRPGSDFRDRWIAANAARKKELNSNG